MSAVTKPTFDTETGLANIVLGSLTAGQRDKVMAQALLYMTDGVLADLQNHLDNSVAMKVDSAADKVSVFNYADAGLSDERITSIVTTSASLGLSYTDTFSYNASSPYRITGITRT